MVLPLGRQTVRKNGEIKAGARRVRLWELGDSTNATVKRLEQSYLSALSIMDRIEKRSAATKADARFTSAGAADDLLRHVLAEPVQALHRGRIAIRNARAEVAEARSKMAVSGPDPADIAAAFRRMEIRTRLREMSPAELSDYFARHGDRLPTEIAQAVVELPPEYSGVPQSRHALFHDQLVRAQFGDALAEVSEIETAIDVAESAIEGVRDEIRVEIGPVLKGVDQHGQPRVDLLTPAEFNERAAPSEKKVSIPWLRKRGNEVCVVDLDRRVERKPTEEELVEGIYADSFEQFEKARAA